MYNFGTRGEGSAAHARVPESWAATRAQAHADRRDAGSPGAGVLTRRQGSVPRDDGGIWTTKLTSSPRWSTRWNRFSGTWTP